jgi:hypothetical protein
MLFHGYRDTGQLVEDMTGSSAKGDEDGLSSSTLKRPETRRNGTSTENPTQSS